MSRRSSVPTRTARRAPRPFVSAVAALTAALSVAAAPTACKRTASEAAPASPPAVRLPGEGDLTTLRLTPAAEQRLGIATATVTLVVLPHHHRLPARTLRPPGAVTLVTAPLAGRVLADPDAALAAGQELAAGATLLRLAPLAGADARSNLLLAKDGAEGRRDRAAGEVEAARIALARARQLLTDKAGSERAVDEAAATLQLADAAQAAAGRELATLTEILAAGDSVADTVTLRTDRRALVTAVHAAPGQLVPAGAPLCDLEDPAALWLRVDVPLALADRLDLAAPVRFGDIGMLDLGAAEPAFPVAAPPLADPLTATTARHYRIDAAESHAPGERLIAAVPAKQAGEAQPVVPSSAIVYDALGGAWVYERIAPHEYRRRRVDPAFADGGRTALARGPDAGAEIVTAGTAELFGTEFGVGK